MREPNTGKLCSPIGRTDYLLLRDIERYRFVPAQLGTGQRVLDLAKGSALGTSILPQHVTARSTRATVLLCLVIDPSRILFG